LSRDLGYLSSDAYAVLGSQATDLKRMLNVLHGKILAQTPKT
jgi:hypothetical protein